MNLSEVATLGIAAVGTLFMLISAFGINRLPDVYARMHASGKAATVGVSGLLLAAGIHFYDQGQLPGMVALIVLFFVTAPIATTTMARAAYRSSKPSERFVLNYDDMAAEPAEDRPDPNAARGQEPSPE